MTLPSGDASIEILEGRYFIGFWFVGTGDRDWLAAAYKDPQSHWRIHYRFRYYADDRAHDSADAKSWWTATINGETAESEIVEAAEAMAAPIAQRFGGLVRRLVLRSADARGNIEALAKAPWAHVRLER